MLSPLLQQLVDGLCGLPGIGPKSAQRMAFQLLRDPKRGLARQLSNALEKAAEHVQHCSKCRLYTEQNVCHICSNTKRNAEQVCVVESPADVFAIEQSAVFRGRYYVLHGHLSPIEGIGPETLGLTNWIASLAESTVKEVIIATNLTVEGEVTAHYIAQQLPDSVQCSRIAHGVPMGGELEYLDGGTLAYALSSRLPMLNSETKE